MRKSTWPLVIVAVFAIVISVMAWNQYIFTPDALGENGDGLIGVKQGEATTFTAQWTGMLYVHIVSSVIALVIGAYQWFPRWRKKFRGAHRTLGMLYGIGVLFGGISGLYLAVYATGGWIAQMGFGVLAVLWLYTAYYGVREGIEGNYREHRKWMLRNYALTFAAVTLRLMILLSVSLFGGENFLVYYVIISWMCWVPNLFVAEWLIRRSGRIQRKTA
ncbi:DUF2306 domain-containing protein [Paenibacillus sp. SC116]|uniref:DUF2306 domain-containing protein n=1 Tax=Paenibacillus sp. SC116 TaxID=2968986 RepID=UPI00215AF3C7|nr:DUF2306 domain-containing protein [Paenibacillus sp. SC116]MCR8845094.1 DUF2306 domain-containing protein [Paenibacillus sp. SC116]